MSSKVASEHLENFFWNTWLSENMPQAFYEEVCAEEREWIANLLPSFKWQGGFATLESSKKAYCLALNQAHVDLRVLQRYKSYEIRSYRTFVSKANLTPLGFDTRLRLIVLTFSENQETLQSDPASQSLHLELLNQLSHDYPQLDKKPLEKLIQELSVPFIHLLNEPMRPLVMNLLARPLVDDFKQVEVLYNHEWQNNQRSSLQVAICAPLVRLNPYLYQLTKLIRGRHLFLRRINATHLAPYEQESKLLITLSLHGCDGRAAWDVTSIPELVHELSMLKLSPCNDSVDQLLIEPGHVKNYQGHIVRSSALFCHQLLASNDPDIYTPSLCQEALTAHPELTIRLVELFESKFHPQDHTEELYLLKLAELRSMIVHLDSGQPILDERRKQVLNMAVDWIDCMLKTNFWRMDKLGLSYRIDPKILEKVPYDYKKKFPELPFAIFFHLGLHTLGFHIRFRDLARGGLRTVLPRTLGHHLNEQNGLFQEAYNLAYTQQKKNKDIPEGGAKGVILCTPYSLSEAEKWALKTKWQNVGKNPEEIKKELHKLELSRGLAYLYLSQKAFVESLLVLVNCEEKGQLKAPNIVDYYKKPEYLFLGPDENMHNSMLIWIEQFSRRHGYRPGGAFISSHPIYGINHKQHGVTSLGIHTYLKVGLHHLGIDPHQESFTVKISGGPDGDVAGNQILNLAREFPKTAKLIALTDVSGTIYDPEGLSFEYLKNLFEEEKPISFYPPGALHENGFLLDRTQTQEEDGIRQKTLLWKKEKDQIKDHWITSHEANLIFRQNVHHTVADVFIPAGGRPYTLHGDNWRDLLIEDKPTCRLIVEGANLYLTDLARLELEKLGVLIFKDSSANKGGVMSSSLEVLMRFIFEPEEMVKFKPQILSAILTTIEEKAKKEAELLLKEHLQTRKPLTLLSQEISQRINLFTDQLHEQLDRESLSENPEDPLNKILFNYAPRFLKEGFQERLLERLPLNYKRAIIANHLACQLVYQRGLAWQPTLGELLSLLLQDKNLMQTP